MGGLIEGPLWVDSGHSTQRLDQQDRRQPATPLFVGVNGPPLHTLGRRTLPVKNPASRARLSFQVIKLSTDVCRLGWGLRKCDCLIEGYSGFILAVELRKEGALHAVIIEIAGKVRCERLDHLKCGGRP